MGLLTCLIAVFSVVVIIASPVPDAEVDFPSPLNGITDFSFGSYRRPPPHQILGGNIIASQDASSVLVLGDSQDLSTGWGDLATTTTTTTTTTPPQSDALSQLMYDSNGNLLAQAHFEDQVSSPPKSGTPTPFQIYWHAECGGTKSVCCSGIGIDTSYNEQPGVPLPCSDKNIKMIDAGYERFLWPGDSRTERYCLEPVYPTDCNAVLTEYPTSRCFSDCPVPAQ